MSLAQNTNILTLFCERVQKQSGRPAYRFKEKGVWKERTWKEYHDDVAGFASGLKALGVKQGDRVALLSSTRPEWAICDMAILSLGAVTVPIYPTLLKEDVLYIVSNSEAQIVIVENKEQFNKLESNDQIKHVITLNGFGDTQVPSFEDILSQGKKSPLDLKAEVKGIFLDDVATIVYTSGTTGKPKGAMITHKNIFSEISDIQKNFPLSCEDVLLTFLPFSHILARIEHFCSVVIGWSLAYAESVDKMGDNMREIKPTLMFSVPRIYEKAYNKILSKVNADSPLKQKIFKWAVGVGIQASVLVEAKKTLPLALKLQYDLATKLVFSKVLQNFGGRIRFLISGGAPLSPEIARFFHAVGLKIAEGYGLTETTAAISSNQIEHYRFGTVGLPLGESQIRIAEEEGYPAGEGEICIKSDKVFAGYYKNEEATRAVMKDGWFLTGDIGRIEEGGFLRITDRKKDIIVTSAGKNIAPQNIENQIKTNRYISQVMVFGDKKNYLTALITLNQDEVSKFAKENNATAADWKSIVRLQKVQDLVKSVIQDNNKTFASFETIKKFHILENDFTIETGELTPTLKLKRKFCSQKYKNILDAFYS